MMFLFLQRSGIDTLRSHITTDSHHRFNASRARGGPPGPGRAFTRARRRRRDGNPAAVAGPGRSGSACRPRRSVSTDGPASHPPRPARPRVLPPGPQDQAPRTGPAARSSRPPPETAAEQRLHIRAPVPGQAGLVANLRQPPAPRPRGHRRRGHPEQRRHLPAGHQVLTHAVAGHCRGGGFPRRRARYEHSQAGQVPALSRSSGSPAGIMG
jgi:hypothetical protein